MKPLYRHQEGAVVGYNPGRPSHSHLIANLRLMLDVEVHDGNQTAAKHGAPGLWSLLERLGRDHCPSLLRSDTGWGNEAVMRVAEPRGLAYLFRIRLTTNVRRAIERAANGPWVDAGRGWQGQYIQRRLDDWGRRRRVVLLRRKLEGTLAISEPDANRQQPLSFAMVDARKQVWEYGALVISTNAEILTLCRAYRDRSRSETTSKNSRTSGVGRVSRHRIGTVAS